MCHLQERAQQRARRLLRPHRAARGHHHGRAPAPSCFPPAASPLLCLLRAARLRWRCTALARLRPPAPPPGPHPPSAAPVLQVVGRAEPPQPAAGAPRTEESHDDSGERARAGVLHGAAVPHRNGPVGLPSAMPRRAAAAACVPPAPPSLLCVLPAGLPRPPRAAGPDQQQRPRLHPQLLSGAAGTRWVGARGVQSHVAAWAWAWAGRCGLLEVMQQREGVVGTQPTPNAARFMRARRWPGPRVPRSKWATRSARTWRPRWGAAWRRRRCTRARRVPC